MKIVEKRILTFESISAFKFPKQSNLSSLISSQSPLVLESNILFHLFHSSILPFLLSIHPTIHPPLPLLPVLMISVDDTNASAISEQQGTFDCQCVRLEDRGRCHVQEVQLILYWSAWMYKWAVVLYC